MTRLEEAVWAAEYVSTLGLLAARRPRTRVDAHYEAVQEADNTVWAMRRGVEYKQRLHADDVLEAERKVGPVLVEDDA